MSVLRLPVAELDPVDVLRISRLAYAAPPWNETPADAARVLARLTRDSRDGVHGALALSGEEVVGYAWVRRGAELSALRWRPRVVTELVELAVLPSSRGAGLGAALHDALLPELDLGESLLVTHARARPALALYRSRGWRVRASLAGHRVLMGRDGAHRPDFSTAAARAPSASLARS